MVRFMVQKEQLVLTLFFLPLHHLVVEVVERQQAVHLMEFPAVQVVVVLVKIGAAQEEPEHLVKVMLAATPPLLVLRLIRVLAVAALAVQQAIILLV
jgi:hypothetical protein